MVEGQINGGVFQTTVKIHFRDADPAGILFFGQVYGLAHDVFEEFLVANGIPWEEWFKGTQWACPIRHSEADYQAPFYPGQAHPVEVKVLKIGQSSFTMHYTFKNQAGKVCAQVQLVHTFVNLSTFQKMNVPEKYQRILSQYL
jgi:acyl-CoA thioester hydrolase/1,4-dihydroxy-2-naphthoyl-CoA hydrolase